jgi:hypothetical protein
MTTKADVDAALEVLNTAQSAYDSLKTALETELAAAAAQIAADPKASAIAEVAAYGQHLAAEFQDGFNAIIAKVKTLI